MALYLVCKQCGKPIPSATSNGTEVPVWGYCVCVPPMGWGHTIAPADWRDAELSRLRAEIALARSVIEDSLMDLSEKLADMTRRKEGWRKVAMEWREAFKNDNYGRDKELHECFLRDIRNWSNFRRNERREARNG